MLNRGLYGKSAMIAIPPGSSIASGATLGGSPIDMINHFSGFLVLYMSAIAADSDAGFRWEGGDEANAANDILPGTEVNLIPAYAGKILMLGIEKPTYRYIKPTVFNDSGGTVNIVTAVFVLDEIARSKDLVHHSDLALIQGVVRPE